MLVAKVIDFNDGKPIKGGDTGVKFIGTGFGETIGTAYLVSAKASYPMVVTYWSETEVQVTIPTVIPDSTTLRATLTPFGSEQPIEFTSNKALNVVELRTVEPVVDYQVITLIGLSTPNEGGGQFFYDVTDETSLDNGYSVIVTGDGKRWIRIEPTVEDKTKADTFADLRTIEPTIENQVIILIGHAVAGVGGGTFRAVLDASGLTDDNGITAVTTGGAGWIRTKGQDNYAEQFGSLGGSNDDSVAYQSAIDYCIENNIRKIRVDQVHTIPQTMTNRTNVVFYGDGYFTGSNYDSGNYRVQVSNEVRGNLAQKDRGLILDEGYTGNVKIVLVGDSLTTFDGNLYEKSSQLFTWLKEGLINDNPSLTIDMDSRGIGGQTWATLNTIPSLSFSPFSDVYPWYLNDTTPWLDYVSALNPDIVFVSLGLNDSYTFQPSAMNSVHAKITAMGAKMVLITNILPSLSQDPAYASYSAFNVHNGCDGVAGYVRSYAKFYKIPLIDINTTFCNMRDGFNYNNTKLVHTDRQNTENGYFLATEDQSCSDFSVKFSCTASTWTNNSNPFCVYLSGGSNTKMLVRNEGTGFLIFRFYDYTGHQYKSFISSITAPTSDVEIVISVRGSSLSFVVNDGIKSVEPLFFNVIRWGGLFRPRVSFNDSLAGGLNWVEYSFSKFIKFEPVARDAELFGLPTASSSTRDVTGGNGINHLSSDGANLVYGSHFNGNSMRLI